MNTSFGSRRTTSSGRRRGVRFFAYLLVCVLTISSIFFLFAGPVLAQPAIITSPLLTQGQVGAHYYATLSATGGTPPYTWSTLTVAPGLSLNASGTIQGTASMAGSFDFVATVTDDNGESDSQHFYLTITQAPLEFRTTTLPSAKENQAYAANLSVTGGDSPYEFSVISGSLPPGLTLNSNTGTITGKPTKGSMGDYYFTIEASDSAEPPATGEESFTITVEKGGWEAVITVNAGLKAGQTKVYSDGSQMGTLQGGGTLNLDMDIDEVRTITVDPIVEHPSETGVRFKADSNSMVVSESSPNAAFTYNAEYSIDLKTDPPQVSQLSGSGWYKEGYVLRATAPDQVNDPNDAGKQYRFTYWQLPSGESISNRDLSLTVSAAGSCTAYYDTYYRLTLTSPYGESEGGTWYKAGSDAKWSVTNPQVRASGILGLFGGKLNAVNASGTTLMDGPKEIAIEWQPDYTMPFIFIPLTIVLVALAGWGIYHVMRGAQPRPAPAPPPFYPYMPPPPPPPPTPIQPPPTTVVMIGGEKPQQLGPPSTREQLMEKFGELLQKYEEEIKGTTPGAKELPEASTAREDKKLSLPKPKQPVTEPEAEASAKEEGGTCNYTSKKPLRVVASSWKQVETRTVPVTPAPDKPSKGETGLATTWTRDIFQEWEVLSCWLPRGHREPHEGSVEIVYSRINTINEEKTYAFGDEITPPQPHYTDGMPHVEIPLNEVVPPEKLPPDSSS